MRSNNQSITAKQQNNERAAIIDMDDVNNEEEKTRFSRTKNLLQAIGLYLYSFIDTIQRYKSFRIFLCSFTITHIGAWLTYIASITLIEDILSTSEAENTQHHYLIDNDEPSSSFSSVHTTSSKGPIGILMVMHLLPGVFIAPFGGVLADSYDRRISMIVLDLLAGFIVLLFVVATCIRSIPLVYFTVFLQEIVGGLYLPCRKSMIPMLVPDEGYKEKAVLLNGIIFSLIGAFAAAAGGFVVSYFGFNQCFLIDSVTYFVSSYLMWKVGPGRWNAADTKEYRDRFESMSLWGQFVGMMIDCSNYLRFSFFGALILLKCTSAVIFGVSDVLNISFSEEFNNSDNNDDNLDNNDNSNATKLGWIFAAVGIGFLIGPMFTEPFATVEKPHIMQLVCIVSLGIAAIGSICIGLFHKSFYNIMLFSAVRSMGGSCNFIYSTMLLQYFSDIDMYGRVSAADRALSLLVKALMAWTCGTILQDKLNLSSSTIAIIVGLLGLSLTILWVVYHLYGMGAANSTALEAHKIKRLKEQQKTIINELGESSNEKEESEKLQNTKFNGDHHSLYSETSSLL